MEGSGRKGSGGLARGPPNSQGPNGTQNPQRFHNARRGHSQRPALLRDFENTGGPFEPSLIANSSARFDHSGLRNSNAGTSRRAIKLVLLSDTLVRLVGALNAVLKRLVFRRQWLSDLIDARGAHTAQIVHPLADLKLVADQIDLLLMQRCGLSAYHNAFARLVRRSTYSFFLGRCSEKPLNMVRIKYVMELNDGEQGETG